MGDVREIAMPTRDELVDALRPHRAEIVEADEWRPLADHVLGLLRGVLAQRDADLTRLAAERGMVDELRAEVARLRGEVWESYQSVFNVLRGVPAQPTPIALAVAGSIYEAAEQRERAAYEWASAELSAAIVALDVSHGLDRATHRALLAVAARIAAGPAQPETEPTPAAPAPDPAVRGQNTTAAPCGERDDGRSPSTLLVDEAASNLAAKVTHD